jgi:hypothetical protein
MMYPTHQPNTRSTPYRERFGREQAELTKSLLSGYRVIERLFKRDDLTGWQERH